MEDLINFLKFMWSSCNLVEIQEGVDLEAIKAEIKKTADSLENHEKDEAEPKEELNELIEEAVNNGELSDESEQNDAIF